MQARPYLTMVSCSFRTLVGCRRRHSRRPRCRPQHIGQCRRRHRLNPRCRRRQCRSGLPIFQMPLPPPIRSSHSQLRSLRVPRATSCFRPTRLPPCNPFRTLRSRRMIVRCRAPSDARLPIRQCLAPNQSAEPLAAVQMVRRSRRPRRLVLLTLTCPRIRARFLPRPLRRRARTPSPRR